MVKYNHTIEETVKAIQVYNSLWSILYELWHDVPESININADDEVEFSVDDAGYSFPINLLTVYDPVYAIRKYFIEKERLRKEAEALANQQRIERQAILRKQREYETYLELKEKYEKLS